MTDSALSEIYTVGVATIRRWRADGRRAGLPSPLTTPEKMPAWWISMVEAGEYQKVCPMGITEAANRMHAALGNDDDDEPGEDDHSALSNLDGESMDYPLSIDFAQTNLKAIKVLLDSAIKAQNERKIVSLQRSFKDAQDTLRALQRDRGKIQAEAGETLSKEEVRSALLELHANVQKRFRQGIKSAFVEIADVAATRESWSVFADGLVDRICLKLTESDFAAD